MVGEINDDDVQKLAITEAWVKVDGPMLITHVPVDRNCIL